MKITLELFERHDKYKGFYQTSGDQSINYGFFDKLPYIHRMLLKVF